jgi:EAL domain-containing protein (putative c-di-GMP-specific phosphodiesterase class I)
MLTKVLKIEVIAEGVETEKELNLLKINKCYNIQGYFYSRPISMEDFRTLYMKSNKPIEENYLTN